MKNILLAIIAVLSLCACDTVNSYERAEFIGVKTPIKDKRIINDSALDGIACVVQIVESKTPDGFFLIQAQVANLSSTYRTINYKFEWLNSDGIQSVSIDNWAQISLEGGEHKFISAVAPNKNVTNFILKILANVKD